MTNAEIAAALEQMAALVADEDSEPFRAQAYRRAARAIQGRAAPVAARYAAGGLAALDDLPRVGPGIARTIGELLETGHLRRLEGRHVRCEAALRSVPSIGPVLAHRIHEGLGVHTLEELRAAAHDGRLERLAGLGARRVQGIREALTGRLGPYRRPASRPARPLPPVAELLDVDREYRDQAARGLLLRIAPHRFNPTHDAWLPVLRTTRGPRRYTALFSNTATAHHAGKTRDWVVLYVDDGEREREVTVVTETRGALAGRRVVRGHEADCAAHYRPAASPS